MSFTRSAFTFRSSSSLRWPSGGIENDGLCDECVKLDLEQSFARAFALYEGARRGRNTRTLKVYRSDNGPPYLGHFYYVTSLGDRLSRLTYCKLCNFLRQTITDPSKGTYKLLVFCSSESYLFEPPKSDARGRPEQRPWGMFDHNVFMAVVPEVPLIPKIGVPLRWFETDLPKNGSIYRLTRSNRGEKRLVLPRCLQPKVELDLVRLWLEFCRDKHDCCGPKKPAHTPLPSFRVINCTKTPPVVEERPWVESYVALSYVWGPPSTDWPQTVLDAVEVTRRLGEQYLWVDRLCINDSDLQEKKFLISKMDAIYEGAEFTIVSAAGDARTGLPGVITTPRKPQPRVELMERSRTTCGASVTSPAASAFDPYLELFGVSKEECEEIRKDREWLDLHRHGLGSKMTIDMSEFMKDQEIMETYDISSEHLSVFKDFADDFRSPIDEWMAKMKQMAERIGIPLQELLPHLLSQTASRASMPVDAVMDMPHRPPRPITSSSKIEYPLPLGQIPGRSVLVSTLEDPRIRIRDSEWAKRGWTYQEGVLSNRRLVFTEEQVYWECHGMATNESLDLPLLDLSGPSGTRMTDYMLSGIFNGDLHRVPELQYGFELPAIDEISEQVLMLDSHINAFTSRNLSYDSDSLNAFQGIAAQYSTNDGLCLLLGIPVLAGPFADGQPGLQNTFALSVSAWTHTAQRVARDAEMYVADCPRRSLFPSWTWAGWKGQAHFSASSAMGEDDDEQADSDDTMFVDFFKAMTSKAWVRSINRLWSAEMQLHTTDGSEATLLIGGMTVSDLADPSKSWLLTIRKPLVLRHMFLMHSTIEGEWRRLMGKLVQLHLSVPMTETELTVGHKSGELLTVLVFASTVPFIWTGTARYLILRKANGDGTRWERIGRLAMTMEEGDMDRYKGAEDMIAGLPVRKFERDIVLI
ncbi:heterokaryon incompatibility protein-domain-containing protein [Usnea florida]